MLILALVMAAGALTLSAQRAARPAEDWIKMLESPARVAGLRIEEVIGKLNLRPGDVVADLGAGTGVFSVPLARAVGPSGKVYAVEIDQGLVDYIAAKARDQSAPQVHALLGAFADPSLPAADVDVAFMHDVLHHVDDRITYLRNAARYLKPDGRFAIVELDATRGAHRNDPALQITREQLREWMAELEFMLVHEFPLFDDKWYVLYRRR